MDGEEVSESIDTIDSDDDDSNATFSASQQPSSTNRRKSLVHKYFDWNNDTGRSRCKIEGCSNPDAGKGSKSSNRKRHMEKNHWKEYQKLLQEEKGEPPSKRQSKQQSIEDAIKNMSNPQTEFENLMALCFAVCGIPRNVVTRPEFCNLIAFVNGCPSELITPSRHVLNKTIGNIYSNLKSKIEDSLSNARRITISADIWTPKGLTSSYLGVVATFYDSKSHKRMVVLLAVKRFKAIHHHHDVVLGLAKEVIKDYAIPSEKIWRIMTDSGSNMIKAFNIASLSVAFDDEEDDVNDEKYNADNEEDNAHDEEDDDNDCDEIDDELSCKNPDDDKPPSHMEYRWMPCFIHALICGMHAVGKLPALSRLIKKIQKFVKSFTSSSVRTQQLKKLAGKTLVKFSQTRWNVLYLVVERLLNVKTELIIVCAKEKIDCFSNSDWQMIEETKIFFEPMFKFTNASCEENETSISAVCVQMKELLYEHIPKYTGHSFLASAAMTLEFELTNRFSYIIDPKKESFDPLFMVSTYLDPRYKDVLEDDEVATVKQWLLSNLNNSVVDTNPNKIIATHSKYKYLDRMRATKNVDVPLLDDELNRYDQCARSISCDESYDPLVFWQSKSDEFKTLHSFALDVLSLPSSTSAVERVFSYCGIATMGLRNRLQGENLEQEIFIKRNREHISL